MISAPTRPQPLEEQKTEAASVKTHGHLALMEWNETLPSPASTTARSLKHPTHRTVWDRCYEGGTVILFATTIAALAASLCRF